MDPRRIEAGQMILFGYFALILGISAGVISLYVTARGVTERFPLQIMRFLLTALLCFWTYRGSIIARWILIVVLGIGGVLSVTLIATGQPAGVLIGGGMALIYLSFVAVVLTSRDVAAFLDSQRDKYNTV